MPVFDNIQLDALILEVALFAIFSQLVRAPVTGMVPAALGYASRWVSMYHR